MNLLSMARRRRGGVALIVTLEMIVLVTILVATFLSLASGNQKIENSRANRVEAEQLAESAMAYVSGQFFSEIRTYSQSSAVGNATVFEPLSVTNMVPLRRVGTAIPMADAGFFNLTRQSVSPGDAFASADNTATPSQNGRFIQTNRWNMPFLLGGAGFSTADQLPRWIYVGRTTGVTNVGSSQTMGRFAYNVYNIGNLLDANVAGYPAGAAANQFKNSTAGADLTLAGIAQGAVDTLISRFRSTDNVDYPSRVSLFSQKGFLSAIATNTAGATVTNNYFLGRQDLLRYARTQNPGMTNALPYLTAFSRSLNAPSWGPLTNSGSYTYRQDADLTTSTNRFFPGVRCTVAGSIPHYADDGFTKSSYAVGVGDPLVQRRFSLAKLAWLTHTGPAPKVTAEAIQACFGLRWNAATLGWDYYGDGTTPASTIKTLKEVAEANPPREPDFFELLQAGILNGSLGKSGALNVKDTSRGMSLGGIYGDETNPFYQIIRIGANAIDQYDTDSYPTPITFNGFTFWGIEDLPYFSKVCAVAFWPTMRSTEVPPVYNYLLYELWNPHQPSTNSATPTKFRVRINADSSYLVSYTQYDAAGVGTGVYPFGKTPLPLGDGEARESSTDVKNDVLYFTVDGTSTDPTKSYREPKLIRDAATLNADVNCSAVVLQTSTVITPKWILPANKNNNLHIGIYQGVFTLEYHDENDAAGVYRPYTTYLGHEEASGLSGMGKNLGTVPVQSTVMTGDTIGGGGFPKSDPRTFRFDASAAATAEVPLRSASNAYVTCSYYIPSFMTAPVSLARLASNNETSLTQFYSDVDGVTRWADCYSNDQNPYKPGTPVVNPARPMILNRPFRSVAELGYVFRDQPFKTLDFFTGRSADAGLLDLFTLVDEPALVAGKVSLYTPYPQILQGLLSGADGLGNVASIVSAYQGYALNADGSLKEVAPWTVAQLSEFVAAQGSAVGLGDMKPGREAFLRAVTGAVQTRTWNLLIDIVAQVGRYPGTGVGPGDFLVEGEKHYWLSLAIDRFTGKIVDQVLEPVNE